MATLPELLDDLEDEYADARGLVDPLAADAPEWDRPTPAVGWAVRDQISHLAFFDDVARMALVEPDEFTVMAEAALAIDGDPMEEHLIRGRSMDGDALRTWWEGAHRGMTDALAVADPADRIPWFGPPMGILSFVSARLMETWAHAQDVADALGSEHQPTDRLHHVAHLGVRARPFSYLVHDRSIPPGRIDITLTAPSGGTWSWEVGPAGDEVVGAIRGSALDFCLVVTQRRHLTDTSLVVEGGPAIEWMSIAQAFAGPPGSGRAAGG
ncbi:MAG: TIGR03084 family metal-binding protein [Acidimicrobiales bacterium]|jgi:uncharacterized protein (TIGR03084 family)